MRDATGYLALARQVFGDVTPHVRHDLLRIPYTLLVLECFEAARLTRAAYVSRFETAGSPLF